MRTLGRLARKIWRLSIATLIFTVAVIVLDAVLSPDAPERRGG